jgi:branched-subunit amino acid ABC-type transport system permease component
VFGLGSAIAAVGAVLWSLDKGVLPTMAIGPLFTGFVVAIIGGIGSMPGAIVGGLLLGLAESLSLLMLPPEMTSIVTFLVLIVVLVIRPTGLFASEIQRLI